MYSCLLSKILRYVSVRYVGIFDSKSELAARNFDFDFIALLFERGHYTLFVRKNGHNYNVNSAPLQNSNVCSLYCIFFALSMRFDCTLSKIAAEQLSIDKENYHKRTLNDVLVAEAVAAFIKQCYE